MPKKWFQKKSQRSQLSSPSWAYPPSRHLRQQQPWGTRRTALRAVGVYLAVMAWLVAGAVLVLLLDVPSLGSSIFVLLLWSGAGMAGVVIAGVWLGGGGRPAQALAWGVSMVVLFTGVAMGVAAPEIVLLSRGQHVTAVVAGDVQRMSKGRVYYTYILRTTDGQPIAGQLSTGDRTPQPLGTPVDVIVDPKGLAAPDFTDMVRGTATGATVVAVLGALVLAGFIAWIANRGEKRRNQ